MMTFAWDVHLETIPRDFFQEVETDLDLVHLDVCGPMPVAYLGGFMYYVIFIDDFFRKTWIFFMKTKDEVFNRCQEFRAQVEKLIAKKIKVLRSNNGGEHTSKDFSDF